MGFLSNCSEQGYPLVAVLRPLVAVASLLGIGSRHTRPAALLPVKSSWTRDQTCVPALAGRLLSTEPPGKSSERTSGRHLRMGAGCQGNQQPD